MDWVPEIEVIRGDRRAHKRYALRMDLRFSYRQGGVAHEHSGCTEDLSHGGIRFSTDDPPPKGVFVELCIEWPHLLQNVCALQLLVRGEVLRSDGAGVVVEIESYEFRTCGERSFEQAGSGPASCSIVA